VGTGLNADPRFGEAAARRIAGETGRPFVSAPNELAALSALFIERGTPATLCGARTLCVQRSQSCERVSALARLWMREKRRRRIKESERVSGGHPRRLASFIQRETPAPGAARVGRRQAGRPIAQRVSRERFNSLVRREDVTHPLGGSQ
jgi:hypothetical protein